MRWFWLILVLGGAVGCGGKPPSAPRPVVRNSKQLPAHAAAVAEVASDAEDAPASSAVAVDQPQKAGAIVEPVFRPEDARPRHDDAKLAAQGIRRLESKRLRLYTDIPVAQAAGLPELMDQAYPAWEAYYGPLPPARSGAGAEFQITGHIMDDKERFRTAGLLPVDLPPFANGRHRGAEFWMNNQKDDYYRRHLMVHEGTHSFMSVVPHVMSSQNWYVEGIAEWFGTHAFEGQTVTDPWRPEPPTKFGIMPYEKRLFAGMGRIEMIREEIENGRGKSLLDVPRIPPDDFANPQAYAWSWALCMFLDTHPRYRERFRHLENHVRPQHAFADFSRLFESDMPDVEDEWQLFSHTLCHGYDIPRAVIDFKEGQPVSSKGSQAVIRADRGWQSTGVLVEAGATYTLSATGQFTVAQKPKPWVSEAQGVSIRYHAGHPLGLLVACIRQTTATSSAPAASTTMLQTLPIGAMATLTVPTSGTLYLRLNDCWNEIADNAGGVQVEIHQTSAKSSVP